MIDILISIGAWAFVIIVLLGFFLALYKSFKQRLK